VITNGNNAHDFKRILYTPIANAVVQLVRS